ncbi:hypothetical protein [Amycolatopsis cihanbeyliensis]|uniref:NB-ARC domain-containing protein n=1 Tax=Amycolatopsis cihanbeyliensis TaxID=1128664 RepID=A0A542DLW4_AMYCI|nr:hypothetical protein [Amycolatopsis cihanbeyliensis]TQJ04079.1 hypothetical protein FB471_3860 [Amycolatopsis cihanbeyliensis]
MALGTVMLEAVVGETVKLCTGYLGGATIGGGKGLVDRLRGRLGTLPRDPERLHAVLTERATDDPEWFADLARQVAELAEQRSGTAPAPPVPFRDCDWYRAHVPLAGVHVIGGRPGSGRTALARRIALDQAHRFPSGRVEVDLDRYRDGDQLRVADVRVHILRRLGVEPDETDPGRVEARYRAVTTTRSFVLILDNARGAREIGYFEISPANLTLATTDELGTDLRAAYPSHVTLHGLDDAGARELLADTCGREVLEREPAATEDLLRLCGTAAYVLGAVGASVARRATEPGPVAGLLAEYRVEGVTGAEDVLGKFLRETFARLDPDTVRACAVLTAHPGTDLTPASAGVLLGRPARRVVDRLIDLALLVPVGNGRYRLDPLARQYAAELAAADEAAAAFERFLLSYRDTAVAGDLHHAPGRMRRYTIPDGLSWSRVDDPVDWLESEREVIADLVAEAHRRGRHEEVCQLVGAFEVMLNSRGHWRLFAAMCEWYVRGAEALHEREGRPALLARAYAMRARAHTLARYFPPARTDLDRALRLAGELPVDHRGRQQWASIHEFRGRLGEEQSDAGLPPTYDPLEEFGRAVRIDRDIGDERALGIHLRMLARALVKAGRATEALSVLDEVDGTGTDARNLALGKLTRVRAALATGQVPPARAALAQAEAELAAVATRQYYWELEQLAAWVAAAEGRLADATARLGVLVTAAIRVGHPRTNEYIEELRRLSHP